MSSVSYHVIGEKDEGCPPWGRGGGGGEKDAGDSVGLGFSVGVYTRRAEVDIRVTYWVNRESTSTPRNRDIRPVEEDWSRAFV